MKVKETVTLKYEGVEEHSGVLSLVDAEGNEIASHIVSFAGNSVVPLGEAVKFLIKHSKWVAK